MLRFIILIALVFGGGCNLYTEIDRPGAEAGDAGADASRRLDAGMNGNSEPGDAGVDGGAECTPQTDLDFCRVNGVDCGDFTGFDNCEQSRTVNCGMCEATTTCGERAPNVCGCPCDIDGTCLGLGAINPNNDCEVCDPSRRTDGWSVKTEERCRIFPEGDTVRIDLGPTADELWTQLVNDTRTPRLLSDEGTLTTVIAQATNFDGEQTGGVQNNDLGWPREVATDTLWVGTFDGHVPALEREGTVLLEGMPSGTYDLSIFASRTGNDSGSGRLTRYEVGGATQDYDPQDNASELATFTGVESTDGTIEIAVRISPAGTSRFAYIGAIILTRAP